MEETEAGRNRVCFKFESRDISEGSVESEFDCNEACGKYVTDVSLV